MKKTYIDIIEKCLSAYDAERIESYIKSVESNGLTEHGFPRLGANIGILIANGRCLEYKDLFCKITELCCKWFPLVTNECTNAGNDFSIREVCWALKALDGKGIVDQSLIRKWRTQLASLNPYQCYCNAVKNTNHRYSNWAMFAAVSDFVRCDFCGIDSIDFVERQLSNQLLFIDKNGMYKDPHNPILYDLMTRLLFMTLIILGYNGEHREQIEHNLDKSSDLTLKMQSVTGEIAFGGRSSQFLYNETVMASLCELYAVFYAKKNNFEKAGIFKAAAEAATENVQLNLGIEPISHIKNRYPIDSMIGCEDYGYFDKYMITAASNAYIAYLLADDTIDPIRRSQSYVASSSSDFHKVFIKNSDYFAEYDINADFKYDANGLGRVHRKGCPSAICLSVPFPTENGYKTEGQNPRPMSICADNAADKPYTLIQSHSDTECASVLFKNDICTEECTVTNNGVYIVYSKKGFMLPVFDFDGSEHTDIIIMSEGIDVKYKGYVCKFRYNGILSDDFEYYYNRSGKYKVYKIDGNKLHIEICKHE